VAFKWQSSINCDFSSYMLNFLRPQFQRWYVFVVVRYTVRSSVQCGSVSPV